MRSPTRIQFTTDQLRRAFVRQHLTREERLAIVQILDTDLTAETLAEMAHKIRRSKKEPMGSIMLAAVLLGLEAGLSLGWSMYHRPHNKPRLNNKRIETMP